MSAWGLMAEFATPEALVDAARRAREAGYTRVEGYSPMPVDGLAEALGFPRTRVPLVALIGGLTGGSFAYALQYWIAAVDYPLNIGGRPLHSWPSFIIVTFELTVLGTALAAFIGMLAMNRLPEPYHPVFNAPRFVLASRDRFFLSVEANDPRFDPWETRRFLETLGAHEVVDVAA